MKLKGKFILVSFLTTMTLAYIPEYLMFLALRKFRTEGGDGNFYFFKTMGRAKDCSCYCCLIENNDT